LLDLFNNIDLSQMTDVQRENLAKLLTPKMSKYCPWTPTPKQTAFLLMQDPLEVLYGGAAGGGKSVVQLMAALQYVDQPNYSALLIRKTYADLAQPKALLDMAKEWLGPFVKSGEVKYSEKDKMYRFPSGATLKFGYLETDKDKYQYQGAAFSYIGVDECTQIVPSGYTYLFSRLRKGANDNFPLRFRATANPGGENHTFYYNRFFGEEAKIRGRKFIGATLDDNPNLDTEAYKQSLMELTPLERDQLLNGNWEAREEGGMFDRSLMIGLWPHEMPPMRKAIRFWDIASTDPSKQKAGKSRAKIDPDSTVGTLVYVYGTDAYIADIQHVKGSPKQVDQLILETAKQDGKNVRIRMEKQPGAAGDFVHEHFKNLLKGYNFDSVTASGSKVERARPLSVCCQEGRLHYNKAIKPDVQELLFVDMESFPYGEHDDFTDSASGGLAQCEMSKACMFGRSKNLKCSSRFRR